MSQRTWHTVCPSCVPTPGRFAQVPPAALYGKTVKVGMMKGARTEYLLILVLSPAEHQAWGVPEASDTKQELFGIVIVDPVVVDLVYLDLVTFDRVEIVQMLEIPDPLPAPSLAQVSN